MSTCSISIIMPAYNVGPYIGEALQSIKDQSEMPDELIIVDDGSTDNTLEVIYSLNLDCPVKVIPIENRGQGNARNIGISEALSSYIYFFDSDDLLSTNFIASMKGLLRENSFPDIILFSGESFNDSSYDGQHWADYSRGFEGQFNHRFDFLAEASSKKSLFCSPCLYLSKKQLWGSGKLEFGSDYYEDQAIFFPLLFGCESFVVVDTTYFYRRNRNESTMTVKPNAKHVRGSLNCIDATLELYRKSGLPRSERLYIRKRLANHCVAHILVCRKAGYRISGIHLINAIRSSKSAGLIAKILIFYMRVDRLRFLKRITRSARTK